MFGGAEVSLWGEGSGKLARYHRYSWRQATSAASGKTHQTLIGLRWIWPHVIGWLWEVHRRLDVRRLRNALWRCRSLTQTKLETLAFGNVFKIHIVNEIRANVWRHGRATNKSTREKKTHKNKSTEQRMTQKRHKKKETPTSPTQ